jgi:hypothetical protein
MPTRRLISLAGLGAIAILLIVYAIFLHPKKSRKVEEIRVETARMNDLRALTEKKLTQTKTAIRALWGENLPIYPTGNHAWDQKRSELINGIDDWLQRYNLLLVKIEPLEPEESPYLMLHPYHLEFSGDFGSICGFLNGLESGMRLALDEWALLSEGGENDALRCICRVVALEWKGKLLSIPEWGRGGMDEPVFVADGNPFGERVKIKSMPTDSSTSSESPQQAERPRLNLRGIMKSKDQRRAIINGRIYQVGERVEGHRILVISEDEVVLEGVPKPLRIERSYEIIPQKPSDINEITLRD